MKRIGVFICWCGSNIAGTVDVEKVAEAARSMPGVVYATDYKYTCSEPGQQMIKDAIREQHLTGVVIGSCSPRMHEKTFRKTVESAGLNPYLLEVANLREHCSWVHPREEATTRKAIDLVRAAVAKVARNHPLHQGHIPVEKRALVIGGGIAGIQAALDIAESGYETVLVEREPSIGGRMAQLDKTFPTLDCSACILTPKMVDVSRHDKVTLLTYSEVEKVEGYIGNFTVTVRRKAAYVDHSKCTGCGLCMEKCPAKKIPSEFEMSLGRRTAIYRPFPQAVPNKPVIDREHCLKFKTGKCGVCAHFCPRGAIDYEQQDQRVTLHVGAIVVATGYDLFDPALYSEYGYGRYPDVITGLHFERLVNSSGPTGGHIVRPSDHKEPKNVVFIQCVGSRDEAKGVSYCSKICCMYTAKHAILLAEHVPGAHPYVFYMDVRTAGKGYEEFYKRATEEFGATYIRGRVSKVYPRGDKLVVRGEDTLLGKPVEIEADLVVLANAVVARHDAAEVARSVGFSYDGHHFFTEAHPKLAPVETNTAGVFLAGVCQGPKDIPETVAQASAAAAKVVALFSKDQMATNPMTAQVDPACCAGCMLCEPVCPYHAIRPETIQERVGGKAISRQVASVNEGLCQGCGACTAACRTGCIDLKGYTHQQILAEVEALCL
ncbi:MAG: CoB--CoM heterodisulfide reductase iron-sulfur subunit A family protein [Firmicutes bacterium]|nr:CoB--CoM heterodisulfide reductase iron-sulfur subunit A family protein [Bacillota bacterium]